MLIGIKPDSEDPEGIYPTFVTQQSGRRVPVVQAYAYTKYLGQLNLEFDSLGEVTHAAGDPLLLDHNIYQGKSCSVIADTRILVFKDTSISSNIKL
jgi:5'-nucleotidase